jgi:hypothetical protein
MPRLQTSNICYCRDDIPKHKKAAKDAVYRHMVDNDAKVRCKRIRAAAGAGLEQLSNSMDMASQDPQSYGAT